MLQRHQVGFSVTSVEVNRKLLNTTRYQLKPIIWTYGPECDAAKAPGRFHSGTCFGYVVSASVIWVEIAYIGGGMTPSSRSIPLLPYS